jgi:hypothetical protein
MAREHYSLTSLVAPGLDFLPVPGCRFFHRQAAGMP